MPPTNIIKGKRDLIKWLIPTIVGGLALIISGVLLYLNIVRESREYREKLKEPRSLYETEVKLAKVYFTKSEFRKAVKHYRMALNVLEYIKYYDVASKKADISDIYRRMAVAHYKDKKFGKALRIHQESLCKLYKEKVWAGGQYYFWVGERATSCVVLSSMFAGRKDYARAISKLKEAIVILKEGRQERAASLTEEELELLDLFPDYLKIQGRGPTVEEINTIIFKLEKPTSL